MIDSARRHAGASWLIKADIHDYFASVNERSVYDVFLSLGYSPLLSFELARLCTWPVGWPNIETSAKTTNQDSSYVYPEFQGGTLPQGAPTSGALSNACTKLLDTALSDLALSLRLVYSRYSDDMVLSSRQSFDRSQASVIIREVQRITQLSGFALHDKKTKIVPPGARKIVLGMLISDSGVEILPEHKRKIRLYIHGVRKYGPVAYSERRDFSSVISFCNHVEGWLAHLSSIDGEWAKDQSVAWREALFKHGVNLNSLK